MSFSIILPIYNEEDNIELVYNEIRDVVESDPEIVFVNDGSQDATLKKITQIERTDPKIKIKNLQKNQGQSRATIEGIRIACNNRIVVMDADGQYDPKDIPKLLEKLNGSTRLVSGVRDNRKDPYLYRTASYYGNKLISIFLNVPKFDLGCGLKAAYKEDLLNLPYFKFIHRYYQIIYNYTGYKVKSININHRQRTAGESKYSLMKIFNILPRIIWLKFKKPTIL